MSKSSSASRMTSSSPLSSSYRRPPASPPHFEEVSSSSSTSSCSSLDPRRRGAHKRLAFIADSMSELSLADQPVKPAKMRRRNAIADVAHAAADIELIALKARAEMGFDEDDQSKSNGDDQSREKDHLTTVVTVDSLRRKRNLVLLPSAMADLSLRSKKTPTRRRRPTTTTTATTTTATTATTSASSVAALTTTTMSRSEVGSVASISLHRDLCRVVSSLHSVTSRLPQSNHVVPQRLHHQHRGQSPIQGSPPPHSHALVLYRPRPSLDEMDGLFLTATKPRVSHIEAPSREDKIDV